MARKASFHYMAAMFVALAALLLYARTVGYEYVWDDLAYLQGFSQYQGLEGITRSFTEPFYIHPDYYRPLAVLSFVISAEPSVQHGINVALHALNTALALYVARALMPRDAVDSKDGLWAAGIGALLFAVHPVAVESTVWVSGRFDTLMCSFVLGTCLAALGGELTRRRLVLVFALFACAMGSKESAVGLPVALPLLLLLKWRLAGMEIEPTKAQTGTLVRLLAALALALALYIAARLTVVQTLFADKTVGATFSGGALLDRLNVAALAVTALVQLIVAPIGHSAPLHPFKYEVGSGVLLLTALVVACVLALLVLTFWRKTRLSFALALLAALAMSWPVLHLIGIPNRDNIISDRYALAPLALLLAGLAAVAGAWAVRRAPELGAVGRRVPLHAAAVCLLGAGVLAAYSSATVPLWRSEEAFWEFAHRQVPSSVTAHMGYVSILMQQKRWGEAKAEVDTLESQHPGATLDVLDLINVAVILDRTGNREDARNMFLALEQHMERRGAPARQRGELHGARALVSIDAGEWEQAAQHLEKAVQFAPTNRRFLLLHAQALFMAGQAKRAEEVFEHALSGESPQDIEQLRKWRATWSAR